jgi:3-hydroxy-9,10-secoandrosta-1,3,5(10)-triene-9,17-dione monooxygenase reductase component
MTQMATELDVQRSFRTIMGRYATGVALITARQGDRQYGMAVNSFTSVSLSPTLLLFCPSRTSTTWPRIAEIGSFCVSLLAAHQEGVSRAFAGRSADRFAGLNWSETRLGHPALAGSLGWIDCTIEATHPAGDHDVVIARAEAWGCTEESAEPLIFFGGKYQPAA